MSGKRQPKPRTPRNHTDTHTNNHTDTGQTHTNNHADTHTDTHIFITSATFQNTNTNFTVDPNTNNDTSSSSQTNNPGSHTGNTGSNSHIKGQSSGTNSRIRNPICRTGLNKTNRLSKNTSRTGSITHRRTSLDSKTGINISANSSNSEDCGGCTKPCTCRAAIYDKKYGTNQCPCNNPKSTSGADAGYVAGTTYTTSATNICDWPGYALGVCCNPEHGKFRKSKLPKDCSVGIPEAWERKGKEKDEDGRDRMEGPLDMTVPELLRHWAELRPDLPALIFRHPNDHNVHTVLTFEELYTLAGRCAALLKAKGVKREDVVVILLPNCPERAIVEAALLLLAAYSVTGVHEEPDRSDLIRQMRAVKATAIVLDTEIHTIEWTAVRSVCQIYDPRSGYLTCVSMPHLYMAMHVNRTDPPNENDFLTFLRSVCSKSSCAKPAPFAHHPCALLATSGRNGKPPKLVLQSHRNMVAFSKVFLPRTDALNPLYFLDYPFGSLRGHLSISVCHPITRVLIDERAGPCASLATTIFMTMRNEKCPIAVIPPEVVYPLAMMYDEHPSGPDKLLFTAFIGEDTDTLEVEAALKCSYMTILSYVSAELLIAAINIVTLDTYMKHEGVGAPIQPGVMVKVMDDDGNELPPDSVGNLLIRSPLMFKGYLRDPEGTAASLDEDGYFRTGDKGTVRNGRLFIMNDPRPKPQKKDYTDMLLRQKKCCE
ncbi:uncharacterized protein [Littorina saxatilis]|uniref:AMP-dependent synthetase/ligase domain-containing protein n=1 Tax=Littorina saxatilis TaxID=31220 RepID=A0AAN9BB49_9CAEN